MDNRHRLVLIFACLISLCVAAMAQTTTTKPAPKKSAAQSGSQEKKAPAAEKAPKKAGPADVIILKGAPMGGVRFVHKAHAQDRNIKCETCHHPSKKEKPAKAAQEACTSCHTPVAKAPMKTKRQAAFHNPTATAGICIDCHKAENATGKKAPTKCTQCHNKANV